jgi:hypothetical protein
MGKALRDRKPSFRPQACARTGPPGQPARSSAIAPTKMNPKRGGDRGSSLRARKDGSGTVFRDGGEVTVLRGERARGFIAAKDAVPFARQPQLMARATGNCKRGSERLAAGQPRNRGRNGG